MDNRLHQRLQGDKKILEGVRIMLTRENNWNNPFWDGKSGERIVGIIKDLTRL